MVVYGNLKGCAPSSDPSWWLNCWVNWVGDGSGWRMMDDGWWMMEGGWLRMDDWGWMMDDVWITRASAVGVMHASDSKQMKKKKWPKNQVKLFSRKWWRVKNQRFSLIYNRFWLIFMDFHWFSLIFIDLHWFSQIFIDFGADLHPCQAVSMDNCADMHPCPADCIVNCADMHHSPAVCIANGTDMHHSRAFSLILMDPGGGGSLHLYVDNGKGW